MRKLGHTQKYVSEQQRNRTFRNKSTRIRKKRTMPERGAKARTQGLQNRRSTKRADKNIKTCKKRTHYKKQASTRTQ